MTRVCFRWALDESLLSAAVLRVAGRIGCCMVLLAAAYAPAQDPNGTVKDGYAIHQSIDLGGHIADYSGSGAMYDTLVNLQSGPRILKSIS